MTETLNSLMQFDHVIRVHEDGRITDDVDTSKREHWAPEALMNTDEDGSFTSDAETDMITAARDAGWEIQTGWTGQYLSGGSAIMHDAEYIGGALEQHIRETPGVWVAVAVSTLDDDDAPCGWIIAHRDETPEPSPVRDGDRVTHPNGMREYDSGIIANFDF